MTLNNLSCNEILSRHSNISKENSKSIAQDSSNKKLTNQEVLLLSTQGLIKKPKDQ